MSYSYVAKTGLGFDEAVSKAKEAFKEQGFGVLTEIDVQATLREKIGAETEPFLILGACNPQFAHRALGVDPSVGVLLPCNVVVRRTDGQTVIEAMDPMVIGRVSDNPELAEIAAEVAARVREAVSSLESAG